MSKLFQPESRAILFLNKVADLMLLNLVWLVGWLSWNHYHRYLYNSAVQMPVFDEYGKSCISISEFLVLFSKRVETINIALGSDVSDFSVLVR